MTLFLFKVIHPPASHDFHQPEGRGQPAGLGGPAHALHIQTDSLRPRSVVTTKTPHMCGAFFDTLKLIYTLVSDSGWTVFTLSPIFFLLHRTCSRFLSETQPTSLLECFLKSIAAVFSTLLSSSTQSRSARSLSETGTTLHFPLIQLIQALRMKERRKIQTLMRPGHGGLIKTGQ